MVATHEPSRSDGAEARAAEATIVCGCSQQSGEAEVAALLDAGVGELFAGWVSERWLSTLGMEVSPNRRYFVERQFTDPAAFARVGALARARGAGFCVTFNEHVYGPEARALLPDLVAAALDAGATGLIVADLELAAAITPDLPAGVELIASTEAGCFNAPTAARWADAGAHRVIFPRELRLDEMAAIARALAGRVALEAFVAREFCVNSSAICYAAHGYGEPVHFCMAHGGHDLVSLADGARRPVPQPFVAHLGAPGYAEALRDLHRCGFCAIETLLDLGVRYLKVPGRSNYALAAVRRLRRLLDEGDLSEAACRAAVDSPAFCAPGVGCYYDLALRDAALPDVPAPTPRPRRPAPAPAPPAPSPEVGLYLTLDAARPGDLLARLRDEGVGAALDGGERPPTGAERAAAERALAWLDAIGLPATTPPRRLYLAQELCASRLWPAELWVDAALAATAAGFEVSAVLPVAYQAYLPALASIVAALAAADAPGLELVVNDLGLLEAAAASGLPVALGRLLHRAKRDQFLPPAAAAAPPADPVARAQRRELGHPASASAFWADLARRRGVSRVGLDVLPTPLSAPLSALGDLEATLYFPWSYVTSSRTCPTAVTLDGAPASLPTTACSRGCHRVVGDVAYPQHARAFAQRGTGTHMDCSGDLAAFAASLSPAPTRLVFTPQAPY